MKAVRAILFDFDGTLADSYAAIAASINHVRACRALPPLAEGEVRRFVGHGPEYLLAHTVPGSEWDVDWPRYREHHPHVMKEMTRLLPGARDALQHVKRTGRRTAVCSNKPRPFTEELLHALELEGIFDVVLGPDDVPRPKPAPDMLLAAVTRLGVTAEQCLYIGDMVVDVNSARAAGITVWVVPTGTDERSVLEAARPDRLLRDLGELAALLEPGRAPSELGG